MAKSKIHNYVFLPGVAKSSNAFPNAYSLLTENINFIKAEAVAYINNQIATDNASNLFPNAVTLLTNNKQFVIDEIIAWIRVRYTRTITGTATTGFITVSSAHFYSVGDPLIVASNVGGLVTGTTYYVSEVGAGGSPTTFKVTATKGSSTNVTLTNTSGQSVQVSYTYSETSCRRDTGFLIDAVIYDVRYGGNEKIIDIAKNFWQGGVLQLYTPALEIAGFNQVFTILTDNVLPKVAYSSQQSPITSTQNVSGSAAEAGVATNITTNLKPIISNAINGGLSTLPAISYSLRNFAGYIYDSSKCDRDIGLVLNAYAKDLRYGGNAETRYISSRFWRGTDPQLSGDRKPEITTQGWIRDLINTTILQQTPYVPLQLSVNRYTNLSTISESGSTTRITSLSNSFISVLTNGLSSLPSLQNGVTTIRLQGKYDLNQLLLITNTTQNEILYNFSDSAHPAVVSLSTGYVSNEYYQDDDFASFRNTADYVTTITFDIDTSTHEINDDIQIFVEEKELRVRPYDYGVDAIERQRVAQAQSMLDADFEYGLQPTKWQAIGLSRGYPSVYEIPGTDTAVSNVTTDASTGTGGVGESLITVTTIGPHGLSVGDPITIKALANSITGFSRAEGTFILNTVPTPTTFTYYATSRVGTSNGQVLATTYTQLRKAKFYTGASIGIPSFSVLTNGSLAAFNSKWVSALGTDQIAFTGTAPSIGGPLTGSGIPSGAQVSGVVGTGGLVVTPTVESNATAGTNSITVSNVSSILSGMAIDNGSGTAVFVSSILGNVLNFSGPITTNRLGNTHTITGISGSNIPTQGFGAVFSVTVTSGGYTSFTPTTAGSNYRVTERIQLSGSSMGGNNLDNNLVIQVSSINGLGGITGVTFYSGIAAGPDNTYTGLTGSVLPSLGLNATFNITRSAGSYSVAINNSGADYVTGERLLILGTALQGTSPTNDATITITDADSSGILTASISGTAISGDTLPIWSAISMSESLTSSLPDNTSITSSAIASFEITFPTAHGLVSGASILIDITSSGSNHGLARGPSYVESVPTLKTLRFTARAAGTVDTITALSGIVYTRPDSFFVHRPYDGGVQLGTGGPQHGAQAVRMSKKYIRYQSGKGINYCTGALFAPSFSIQSISATGTSVGSFITIVMDDVDHGCQTGGVIEVHGIETKGYNNTYVVSDVINERQLRVQAVSVLENVTGTLSVNAQLSLKRWHGATVRAGTFDEQNGLFFQYDGQNFGVARRSATFQIAGTSSISRDTNLISGTNTRFRDQIKAGDRIVIKGMTHIVTNISSQTEMTVNPDYRGAVNAVDSKICLVQDFVIRQNNFNLDKLDGTGPSGYNIDITKMQMIGMQWSWYAVGFIDFMLRGSDGNFIFFHRIRNSNVNTEAYMRTGNQPVRYEVINESAKDKLLNSITASQTTIPLVDAIDFPNESATILIDNELITYTGKTGNTLTGCTRAAPLINFSGGAQRSFTAGTASTHEYNTGVVLVSNTISPIISHWGSAMLTDGNFDEDRGYIFSYTAANISVSTTRQTAFLIRLAPSVSNAIVGDLGERELLNRAQLLLRGIEITADTGTGGLIVEGVLNPQNYPLNPTDLAWVGLSGIAQGGQPSFAQIASGGSVNWNGGASLTTTTATVSADIDTGFVYDPANDANERVSPIEITLASRNSAGPVIPGAKIFSQNPSSYTGTGSPSRTYTVTSVNTTTTFNVFFQDQFGSTTNFTNLSASTTIKFVYSTYIGITNRILFTKATWESSGATIGTSVASTETKFPAGTKVSNVSLLTLGSTQFYEVTFSQSSTTIIAAAQTITFEFGNPPYAQPGETIFSFIASPGSNSHLYLDELPELTNTVLGGRGTYPNGPDVLAINVYKVSGTAINTNIVLRWGEAQA